MCAIPMEGWASVWLVRVPVTISLISIIAAVGKSGRIRRLDLGDLLVLAFAMWSITSTIWAHDVVSALGHSYTVIQLTALYLVLRRAATTTTSGVAFLAYGYTCGALIVASATMYESVRTGVTAMRYAVGMMNPGQAGGLLALGIPCSLLLLSDSQRSRRLLGVCYLPVAVLAIILTGTRTAFIAAFAALLVFSLTSGVLGSHHRRRAAVGILALSVISGVAISRMPSVAGVARILQMREAIAQTNLSGRESLWSSAIRLFLEQPLTGVGAGSFAHLMEQSMGGRYAAHNTWLSVGAELGLVGLTLFSAITAYVFVSASRATGIMRSFGWTLGTVWLINASMGSDTYTKATWVVYSLACALPVPVVALHTVAQTEVSRGNAAPARCDLTRRVV